MGIISIVIIIEKERLVLLRKNESTILEKVSPIN